MAAFKASPPTVVKRKKASFGQGKTAYEYATLDEVSGVIGEALSKHGLSHRWEVEQRDGGAIRVTCVVTHVMGHSERVSLEAGPDTSGSKNNIQAVGSTVTYLERYTLLAATGLAAADQDDDAKRRGHDERTITAQQKAQIIDRMKKTGTDTVSFLAYFKVEVLDDLPAAEFPRAMKALDAKGRKQQAKKEG